MQVLGRPGSIEMAAAGQVDLSGRHHGRASQGGEAGAQQGRCAAGPQGRKARADGERPGALADIEQGRGPHTAGGAAMLLGQLGQAAQRHAEQARRHRALQPGLQRQ